MRLNLWVHGLGVVVGDCSLKPNFAHPKTIPRRRWLTWSALRFFFFPTDRCVMEKKNPKPILKPEDHRHVPHVFFRKRPNSEYWNGMCLRDPYRIRNIALFGIMLECECARKCTDCSLYIPIEKPGAGSILENRSFGSLLNQLYRMTCLLQCCNFLVWLLIISCPCLRGTSADRRRSAWFPLCCWKSNLSTRYRSHLAAHTDARPGQLFVLRLGCVKFDCCAWTDFGHVCCSRIKDCTAYRDASFWHGCAVSW